MRFDRLGRAVLCVLVTAPNWVPVWSMFPAGWGKVPLFLLGISVLMLLALVSRAHTQEPRHNHEAHPSRLPWMSIGLLFFLLANGIAALCGVYWWKSVWGEQARQNGVLLLANLTAFAFFLGYFFRTPQQWKWFDRFLVWSAVLPAVAAILEATVPAVGAAFGENGRYAAWFGNYLFLGGYLSVATFAAVRLAAQAKGAERWAVCAGAAACVVGVFLTASRGPVLSLLGGGVVMLSFVAYKRRPRIALLLGGAMVAFGVVLFFFVQTGNGAALPTPLRRLVDTEAYMRENVPRLLQWKIAWKGFIARPLTGWGPENYQTVFDRLYDPALLRYSFYETVSDKPHNLWLETLATGGVLVFGALLFLLSLTVRTVVRLVRQQRLTTLAGGALLGGVAAYAIQATFLFDTLPVSLLLFAVYGYLRALSADDGIALPYAALLKLPRTIIFVGAGVGACVLIGANVYAGGFGLVASNATLFVTDSAALAHNTVRDTVLERALWTPNPFQEELRKYIVTSVVNRDASGELSPDFVTQHKETLLAAAAQSAQRAPDDFLVQFVYGEMLTLVGAATGSADMLEQARTVFGHVMTLSPGRQATAVQLAKVLLLGGQPKDAVGLLGSVVAADPAIAEPHWYLGLALSASGDDAGAAREMAAALARGRKLTSVAEAQFVVDIFAKAQLFEEIVPIYKQLIAREPNNAMWHARLAATYASLGKSALAVGEAQAAAALDPAYAAEAKRFTEQLIQQ